MGYTTRLKGQFHFDKMPHGTVLAAIGALDGVSGRTDGAKGMPDSYCQWTLTKDFSGIHWDGGEKFYDYVEWAQWIIDKILTPANIALYGEIEFFGEDSSDIGKLVIADGKVKSIEFAVIRDDSIADLLAFKRFVLAHDDGSHLLAEFARSRR